ncbi:MAG: nucleoside-diphosphate kinase [Alphaproteobacteria bacterium HGW-Alphaproteobacteria-5]|nr:MAG: nucleoside-diphosphate kinase [Alphaproteobacteria bacterium HGW-Alphaproteobacteria-5]
MAIIKRTTEAFADLPPIVVAEEQFDEICEVSELLIDAIPEVGRFLERELERARLVPLFRVPLDVVTVGSTAEFIFGATGRVERLALALPENAVSREGVVSLASPVGVALLGMKIGNTISWNTRYGDQRSLKVIGVQRNR